MKTIFDPQVRAEITKRIQQLTPDHKAQWGKMNAHQMIKHCTVGNEMFHGERIIKPVFIGYIIGKWALKQTLKNEDPIRKNSPTTGDFLITKVDTEFEQDKNKWIGNLEKYATYNNPSFKHPFFGKMNREQVGLLAYKHTDHHLRQFGV
jgi:hypothetical protein